MKRSLALLALASVSSVLVACGGDAPPPVAPKPPAARPSAPVGDQSDEAVKALFQEALDAFAARDKASDWGEAACADIAKKFEAVEARRGKAFAEASYNAGLSFQRCGNDKEAKARFEKALAADPNFHNARAQLALYKYRADGDDSAAIQTLQQVVLDAQFQNVGALVALATLQAARDSATPGDNCANDMECAKKNLQRALAIDDAYMPALNQLALYYFQLAKKRVAAGQPAPKGLRGRTIATSAQVQKRADVQQLELAALVCSQAIKKNPSYAPIHNTAGLIQNELGQVNGAVSSFSTATRLDAKFFEALMNFAAVNLSFRGFEAAQGAYAKAIALRPNDYDAHLGMALALRGQITDMNYDKQLAAVQAELETCKKLDGARPDAFFNEGILTQEYRAKSGGDKAKTIATLEDARKIFDNFVQKADSKTEYDVAVKRAKERMQDIGDTIQFLNMPGGEEPAKP
jgi:tetratricopeptide (TPR) repeat protein